jgi:hypothetical protein
MITGGMHFLDLSLDNLRHIFSFLNPSDVCSCAITCNKLAELAREVTSTVVCAPACPVQSAVTCISWLVPISLHGLKTGRYGYRTAIGWDSASISNDKDARSML